MPSVQLDDGRVGSRIENYAGFWQKDIKKEAQVDSDTRVENYTDVVNGAAR
jgi:sterol 24-C-methyltransferase